ncbi:MAG: 2-oxoglutarate dehydrogenase E1 component, partial [bacterium]|nr:2-oxoglutarate dehydrogenase E1 component [bacterium]
IIGMAHRGRLNVLANVVGKPYAAIFAEFDDIDPKTFQGTGDVKYHLGARGVHRWKGNPKGSAEFDEREVRVELACNPSHLEAVDPVVEGQVRAQQDLSGDRQRKKIMPLLLHGDAAFATQGVVYETMQCANLQGYRTGGTVHVIINNQIGYTTPPERARSSLNCSDVARAVSVPVFRVNGDDPEACIRAVRLAFEYRMLFGKDVVIDLVCYRRHGHNEGDEPSFTQPILYAAIQKHPSVATFYGQLLVRRGDITNEEFAEIRNQHDAIFEEAHVAVKARGRDAFSDEHIPLEQLNSTLIRDEPDTKVSVEVLKQITEKVTYDPELIEIHPRVKQFVLERRRSMVFDGKIGIDFGMAEILAYGSLLLEGIPIRLSGQDCGRGTFAHRHAVLYDINDGTPYIGLNHLHTTRDEGEEVWHPSRFRVYDSPLSEEAVLGFEYGYSVRHPKSLVIWEAQFGDFFNGAQIQIDQFISSSETKWRQRSRLTLFLPHGYDGQGPEHSSARIERFLQLCAEDNMRVANCSTAAQLFHLLRRQAKLPKKPLIIFSHKSLLRAEDASSTLSELADGGFSLVIDDPNNPASKKIRRLIFVSGKIYWDLDRYRREKSLGDDVSIVRIEQMYPFPKDHVDNILQAAGLAKDIVWLQEEPKNCGAYSYMDPLFRKLQVNLRYIGRVASASPASGSPKVHHRQQQAIVEAAFAPVVDKIFDVEVS